MERRAIAATMEVKGFVETEDGVALRSNDKMERVDELSLSERKLAPSFGFTQWVLRVS